MAGAPGEWDAWMFFSSEKSCLITSKKLLNGLPTQTGRKEQTERENKQMSNGVNGRRGGGDGGREGEEEWSWRDGDSVVCVCGGGEGSEGGACAGVVVNVMLQSLRCLRCGGEPLGALEDDS